MESKIRYQNLPENFFDIIRRRKLKLDECFLAIYFRGKCGRFCNPFWLTNKTVMLELNISRNTLRTLRNKLQETGVIKFNSFEGRGLNTIYTMLDSIMVSSRKINKRGQNQTLKGSISAPFNIDKSCSKRGQNQPPNNRNKNKKEIFIDTRPQNWKEKTLNNIK